MGAFIEYLFSSEMLTTTIPWLITNVLITITTIMIIAEDYRRMKVKAWVLLLFVGVGIIGMIVTRLIAGTFNWWDLLPIPVYFVLWVINSKFNHNRFIGQADVDILHGSIALYFPIIWTLASVDYGYTEVNMIHIMDSIMGGLWFLLIGYILALVIAVIRMVIQKLRGKKIKDLDLINSANTAIADPGNSVKDTIKGLKIPVAISFVPLYYYALYVACFVAL